VTQKKNTSFTKTGKVGLDQAIDEERNDSYLCKLQWRGAEKGRSRPLGLRGAGVEGTGVGGRREQRAAGWLG
jgi:hypothetical protein